ncbi:MAG TPA: TIGR01906 family membrane protein, partial [Terriglobales bacterium]|nr:TIGR01906 family membrane protein [Terriglobales bacterium]
TGARRQAVFFGRHMLEASRGNPSARDGAAAGESFGSASAVGSASNPTNLGNPANPSKPSKPSHSEAVAARVSAGPDLLAWLSGLVSIAFILLLPLLIIGTSLRGLVTDRDFMLRGFRDNNVAATTGLDDPQLQRIADAFVTYFQSPPGQIQMQVTAFGQQRLLFNDREVAHMEDVQALIQFFLRMQIVAAVVVAVRLAVALFVERGVVNLGRDMLLSVGMIVALIVVVAVASMIDFDALWTRFHQIAFRNNLWLLDPSRDYLIMLFPEPFWFAATIRMAISVAAQTALVALIGLGLMLSPRLFARG